VFADHHDYHHQAFKGCYASSFRHWDYLMGTEGSFHKVRLQQRREKAMRNGKIVFGRKEMAREMGAEERVKVE
jgi:sterol desaturase/sphingolipid hydroxylase (fatty acid hydroxylase superfamily)